ncbi:hypothetical protein F3Y22_tig00110777pilonHSYRG00132 [Hibiscus syriacus]|uniref:Late embryogenesis abundant protein LEA-2 subgroup domain-containing protein n=1 Tax=Hibiscus syriacus TaxID=106335 RepID=A0A6A2ZS63_HIBSY|nr:uncharacterized protein LOC120139898 [Hibiscus syriacus]KAE8694623.1 hypothetical protein F3Y22_tig00110777pilonHSYRG00132 [Hibiscus syriacus]
MAEHEQVKPLAPATFQARSDDREVLSTQSNRRKKIYIQCCGCMAALSLILAVVIIVLFFTVFHIHDPRIKMNSVTIQRLELVNGTLRPDVNVTLLADVSFKNRNVATFKFNNSTTLVYYGGTVIGEAVHLRGEAKARRTLRRNVTVELVPEKIMGVPSFMSDVNSGALNISSYSWISGRVKIMKIIKKNVVVRLNCTMTFRISRGEFVGETCRPELDF